MARPRCGSAPDPADLRTRRHRDSWSTGARIWRGPVRELWGEVGLRVRAGGYVGAIAHRWTGKGRRLCEVSHAFRALPPGGHRMAMLDGEHVCGATRQAASGRVPHVPARMSPLLARLLRVRDGGADQAADEGREDREARPDRLQQREFQLQQFLQALASLIPRLPVIGRTRLGSRTGLRGRTGLGDRAGLRGRTGSDGGIRERTRRFDEPPTRRPEPCVGGEVSWTRYGVQTRSGTAPPQFSMGRTMLASHRPAEWVLTPRCPRPWPPPGSPTRPAPRRAARTAPPSGGRTPIGRARSGTPADTAGASAAARGRATHG